MKSSKMGGLHQKRLGTTGLTNMQLIGVICMVPSTTTVANSFPYMINFLV